MNKQMPASVNSGFSHSFVPQLHAGRKFPDNFSTKIAFHPDESVPANEAMKPDLPGILQLWAGNFRVQCFQ